MIKKSKAISLFILLFFQISFIWSQQNSLWVGASSSKIVPSKKSTIYLAGTKENRISTGVNDPIFAKALFVSDGKTSMALLTLDCIGLLYSDVIKIREQVALLLPSTILNSENIVVSSTHTHHAPDVVGLWGENKTQTGVNQMYMTQLIDIAAKQIVKAYKKRKPATIKYATSTHGEGWVSNISIEGEVDNEVSILQFLNKKNKSIASITNFACHTTVLNGDATLISSDFAGGLYQKLDQSFKGVNMFLQGAIGGWVQPVNIEPTYANAMKVGKNLGQVVVDALSKGTTMNNTLVTYQNTKFTFPVENENFKILSKMKVINREVGNNVASEISYFTIGDAGFITHPGETSPAYSDQSKKLMPVKGPKFVLGLSQDALGYILKPVFFNKDHQIEHADYLISMSIHRRAAIIMMQQIQQLIAAENK
jgi:hypothetical protein